MEGWLKSLLVMLVSGVFTLLFWEWVFSVKPWK